MRGEQFSAFFLQFCIFQVNRGKNMHNFYQLGKKYAFSPLFVSPLNNFFPQPVIWPYFCPPPKQKTNRKIYTPANKPLVTMMIPFCACSRSITPFHCQESRSLPATIVISGLRPRPPSTNTWTLCTPTTSNLAPNQG